MSTSSTKDLVSIPVIVILNLLTYLLQLTMLSTEYWAMVPLRLTQSMHTFYQVGHEIATLFYYQFLHGSPVHLFFNMLLFILFGRPAEREFGAMRFLGYYLASGVVGALGVWALNPHLTVVVIGASGSIAGIMGAFLTMHIRQKARLNILTTLGGAYILIWWLPDQVIGSINMLAGAADTPVGCLGHLLGFITGVTLTWRYCRRTSGSSTQIALMPPSQGNTRDENL